MMGGLALGLRQILGMQRYGDGHMGLELKMPGFGGFEALGGSKGPGEGIPDCFFEENRGMQDVKGKTADFGVRKGLITYRIQQGSKCKFATS